MDNILLVSSNSRNLSALSNSIKSSKNDYRVFICSSASETKRLIKDNLFSAIVILPPLKDEFGDKLAKNIVMDSQCQVIFIVSKNIIEEMPGVLENFGIITMQTPINLNIFLNTLKLSVSSYRKLSALKNENEKLSKTLEDIKIINRAKLILVSQLRMSESEAHKYIEKKAMDLRITKRKVAESILATYEN